MWLVDQIYLVTLQPSCVLSVFIAVMALHKLRNDVVHVPRQEDPGPMDERILNWEDEDFVWVEEENNVPLRGILAGHVVVRYFGASTQLQIVIGQMHHFCELHQENWTHS